MESYFSRWASVLGSVRSLTATNSSSRSSMAVRSTLRPMRPNPLMPTLIAMQASAKEGRDSGFRRSKQNQKLYQQPAVRSQRSEIRETKILRLGFPAQVQARGSPQAHHH